LATISTEVAAPQRTPKNARLTRACLGRIVFTLTALAGPAFADRFHFERVQAYTLGFMGVTMLLVGLVPQAALLGIFVLAALTQGFKGIFDAALQGLVGNAAPPDKVGSYTGLVELAWGFSSLVGLPVAGAILAANPRAMFLFLGAVQIAPALALRLATPLTPWPAPADAPAAPQTLSWRSVATHAGTLQVAASIMVVIAAVDMATILFGVWLQDARGLDTGRVAAATLALGFADVGGEALATAVIDRLGIPRALRLSLLCAAAAAAALAASGDAAGLGGLIAGLTFHFLYFIGIEVAIVALLAASAVVLPQGGGRAEALTVCGMGLGHIAGAFVSLPIWEAADRRLFGYALLAGSACAALAGVSWALERFTRLGPLGGAGGASQEDRRIAADDDAEEQKREDDGEAQAVGASA
jgi:predicted MFS family arabinose efflux permease